MAIKEPRFDRPRGLGATTSEKPINKPLVPENWEIRAGTRVLLRYHGKELVVTVIEVERPEEQFVGRVLAFIGEVQSLHHGDLASGEEIRFKKDDVSRIE